MNLHLNLHLTGGRQGQMHKLPQYLAARISSAKKDIHVPRTILCTGTV